MVTHREIAERWALNAGIHGATLLRSTSRNLYVDPRDDCVINSFGSHFPLAVLMPCGRKARGWFLPNGDRYSHSTEVHQAIVRDAVSGTGLPSLGASVFTASYGLQQRRAYFLSAFDEQEGALYFLAQMPRNSRPRTVRDALEALKPPQITAAEAVRRLLGERLGVPADEPPAPRRSERAALDTQGGIS